MLHRLVSSARPRRHRLEVALDRCLDDLLLRGRSIDRCLAEWPELREELAPLLRLAQKLTSAGLADRQAIRDEVARAAARRAEVMGRIRNMPQDPPLATPPVPARARLEMLELRRWLNGSLRRIVLTRAFLAAGLATALLMTGIVFAPVPAPTAAATLSVLTGNVELHTEGAWRRAADEEHLSTGALVRTTDDGRAVIAFPGGVALLEPGSTLRLVDIAPAESPGATSRLRLEEGRAWFDLVTVEGDRVDDPAAFALETRFAQVAASAASFEVIVTSDDAVVAVDRGEVTARRGSATRALGVGRHLVIAPPPERALDAGGPLLVRLQDLEPESSLEVRLSPLARMRLIDPGGASTAAEGDAVASDQPASRLIPGSTVHVRPDGPRSIAVRSPSDGTWRLVVEPGAGEESVTLVLDGEEHRVPLPGVRERAVEIAFEVRRDDERRPALRVLETPGRGDPPTDPPARGR